MSKDSKFSDVVLQERKVPIVDISFFFEELPHNSRVYMFLDFMNHQFVSGNKLRKLQFHLNRFLHSGKSKIVSVGGYFSNHLTALAWITCQMKIPSLGIINGNQPPFFGASLRFLHEHNMELRFVSKAEFKSSYGKMTTNEFPDPDSYFIPLGGRDTSGLLGFEEMVSNINDVEHICIDEWWVCYGSGTSASAIVHYIQPHQKVFAQGAVNESFKLFNLDQNVIELSNRVYSQPDTVFGGVGKFNEELISTINDFNTKTGIPLDPIYTGKLVYYFKKYIKENLNKKNKSYLLIHSGGLQGIEGFNEMKKTSLSTKIDNKLLDPLVVAKV